MLNNDLSTCGIYRCKLIKDKNDIIRAIIPGLIDASLLNSDGTLKYEYDTSIFPKVEWCAYNIESTIFNNSDNLSFVMFENGDSKRPICISYNVIGETNNETFNSNDYEDSSNNDIEVTVIGSKSEKISWLFDGKGLPKSESQMIPYLQSITVNINDKNGKKTTMKLIVHKKLAGDIVKIFDEICNSGFKILSSETGAYVWRRNNSGTAISQHSYGTCIDINWNYNPYYKNKNTPCPNSQYKIPSSVVSIFAKYGWSWGGNACKNSVDYMHFTYLGG